MGSLSQYVSPGDFLLALPIILLTLFAIGVLLIDLLLPPEWKWMNAATALVGIGFAAYGVFQIQRAYYLHGIANGRSGFLGALVVDHFAIYFFYLFLAGTAVSVLMSVRYLEI